jgi:RNA polymerase sigma factor (sigma-70 family)
MKKGTLLSREDECFLLKMRDNDTALDILVASNTGLVRSIANKYAHIGYNPEDMVQAGIRGLLVAIERHDGSTKLSTYAYVWIRKYILEEIEQNHRTIRLPSHVHETMTKVNKAIGSGCASLTSICIETGLPADRVVKAMEAFSVSTCPINNELDTVEDNKHNPGSMGILEALDALTPDERDCVMFVVGINDDKPPFDEVAFTNLYNTGIKKIKEQYIGKDTRIR